jgi:phosphoribosylformimino-5-aminoimidazole carboxamide ribotide isomerase
MIEIIPAIDLIDGKCVRLSQGNFSRKKIYSEEPLEVAKEFESFGIRRLHLVDLDGAKTGKIANLKILENIAVNTDLTIDFGGGIRTEDDLRRVFSAGASIVSIGSIAVKEPEKFFSWIAKYESEKILLGIDVRDGKLAINGWLIQTNIEILPLLKKYVAKGVTQVFCTDISKDGILQGAAKDLYTKILAELPDLMLIASGGVGKIEDIYELEKIGCSGVIVGKAIYEGKIKLKDLQNVGKKDHSVP